MDSTHRYFSQHRQSIKPASGISNSSLASRYGLNLNRNSSSTLSSVTGRNRSNSTSRFKAAAAVAVAAATRSGNSSLGKHHHSSSSINAITSLSSLSSSSGISAATNQQNASSSASQTNSLAGAASLSSSVVSFMKKFVNKATPNTNNSDSSNSSKSNSIDYSFEQYQQQLAQQPTTSQQTTSQSPTKYLFTTIAGQQQPNDTGYSSNTNSPVTTPTVCSSLSSASPASLFGGSSTNSSQTITNEGSTVFPSRSSSTPFGTNSGSSSSANKGPLFSKIRAKVASTFQPGSSSQTSTNNAQSATPSSDLSPINGSLTISNSSAIQQAKLRSCSISSTSGSIGPIDASPIIESQSKTMPGTSYQHPPMLSMIQSSQSSSLTNEQLTAHLTVEEKQILQKVWQKEEEFREIALKNFSKSSTNPRNNSINLPSEPAVVVDVVSTPPSTTTTTNNQSPLLGSSPVIGGSVSHLSANLLDPVAAAVHRRRSSTVLSADASGLCRICRKIIMKDESGAHRCSNCHELVCDDCSSYSSREESKYWMCSFCRRRGSQLVLVTTISSTDTTTTTSTVCISKSNYARMSVANTNESNFLLSTVENQNLINAKRKLSFSEFQRPKSAMESIQNQTNSARQGSLDSQKLISSMTSRTNAANTMLDPSTSYNPIRKLSFNDQLLTRNNKHCSFKIESNSEQGQQKLSLSQSNLPSSNEPRTRIYSLSDDEDFLTDEEDDDDIDDQFDQHDDDEREEEKAVVQHEQEIRVDDLMGNSLLMKNDEQGETFQEKQARSVRANCRTLRTKNKNATLMMINQNGHNHDDQSSYHHQVGGASHGTLASVPLETLKQQRNMKKKKKKLIQHSNYNSDDELLNNKKKNDSVFITTPPITITNAQHDFAQQQQPTTIPSYYSTGSKPPQSPLASSQGGDSPMFPINYANHHQIINQPAESNGIGACPSMFNKFPIASNLPQTSLQQAQQVALQPMPKIISTKPQNSIATIRWWRLSSKARGLSRSTGGSEAFYNMKQQQRSSESSDYSDGFKYSPPPDSLTPSSEYSRSPRQSADSEMLGLQYSSLVMQRRSIPSVLVDVGEGSAGSYLSTKDCYLRRGSTGRVLPQIPVEPCRSMLDLPHSRKSSQHSLDIPMEQPRRASAPEGENIRIVIDEVTDMAGNSHQDLSSIVSLNASSRRDSSTIKNDQTTASSQSTTPVLNFSSAVVAPVGPIQVQQHQTSYQQRMKYQLTRAASIVTHYERVTINQDKTDPSTRTRGFSLAVTGGKLSDSDGMLYAYVTWIKPGGQADKLGLKNGDKILEWNTKSLVNCSHEQVCHIMDNGGAEVEIIVESTVKCDPHLDRKRKQSLVSTSLPQPSVSVNQQASFKQSSDIVLETSISKTTSSQPKPVIMMPNRASSAAAIVCPTTPAPSLLINQGNSAQQQASSQQSSGRRKLPQIPGAFSTMSTTCTTTSPTMPISLTIPKQRNIPLPEGKLLLQVTIDANIRQLSVMIDSARGLEQHPFYCSDVSYEAFAQLQLLPEMGFKICQTELNATFEWNETLIYHQFPIERIDQITLDLSVWCGKSSLFNHGFFNQNQNNNNTGSSNIKSRLNKNENRTIDQSSYNESDPVRLAHTQIPLRSALFHLPEWWPLISIDVQSSLAAFSGLEPQSSFDSAPSPAPHISTVCQSKATATTAASTIFFHKVPSMDYIEPNPSLLMCEQFSYASRSTPGSRRNSNRSDYGDMPLGTQSKQQPNIILKKSPSPSIDDRPPTRYGRHSRASSTFSSSNGNRHSLDESSSYSAAEPQVPGRCSSGGSLTLERSSSLRFVQNRHSVGNLYYVGFNQQQQPNSTALFHVSDNNNDHHLLPCSENVNNQYSSIMMMSQQKNSATAENQHDLKYLNENAIRNLPTRNGSISVDSKNRMAMNSGYQKLPNTESYQNLMDTSNRSPLPQRHQISNNNIENFDLTAQDQDSIQFSSDDDIDNLLTNSNYTLDSSENNNNIRNIEAERSNINKFQTTNADKSFPNQSSVVDSNKISVAFSRKQSDTNSSMTPSNEEDSESGLYGGGGESSATLLTANLVSERRPSFFRRLIPSATLMIGGSGGGGVQPSDEILDVDGFNETRPTLPQQQPVIVGELKLGFIMTKGFLEIEVIAARGLPNSVLGPDAPSTYVKIYLCDDSGRHLHKRKTRTIGSDRNPQYRQTLKYDATIINGRTLLVSVWEKQRRKTFGSNTPIGAVEINVDQLELHKLTIRWYKLLSFSSSSAHQNISH